MAQIGQLINGKYKILRLIDKGGMSKVYLAEDISMSKEWVVKEILKTVNGRDNILSVKSAVSEADIIKSLDHPSIVRIVDMMQDERAVYIVEDYVSGISLQQVLERDKVIDEHDLIQWGQQICEILGYLHSRKKPVIYRDIKPENIILADSGHIKLIDFGIARRYDPEKALDTRYLGTEKFAAPEQYEEFGRQTDARTDIYGLGATLKYLSGGCRNISADLKKIIEKCTMQQPDDRYQNADSLMKELQKAAEKYRKRKKNNSVSLLRILIVVAAVICVFAAASAALLRSGSRKNVMNSIREVIEGIKSDELFTEEEEEQLLNIIMPNLSELKEKEGFDKIAFSIGKLYWYYYEYGSNELTGIVESIPWFELAHGYSDMADIYKTVGEFYRDINKRIIESEDEGMYSSCFEQLARLVNMISTEENSEMIRLEIYRLAANALQIYARKFRSDGVSVDEINSLYADVAQYTASMNTTSIQSDAMKQEVLSELESAGTAISRAYEQSKA